VDPFVVVESHYPAWEGVRNIHAFLQYIWELQRKKPEMLELEGLASWTTAPSEKLGPQVSQP
jgi:hypothetical protein